MANGQLAVPGKLRHLQTFTSSGNFYPPVGVTRVFVSIYGATGGGNSGGYGRYSWDLASGDPSQSSKIIGAYIQVNPGVAHPVIVGAAGAGGVYQGYGFNAPGGTGGNSSFDGVLIAYGSNAATAGSSEAKYTTLPSENPGAGTSTKVDGYYISTSEIAGSAGGQNGPSSGVVGTAAIVHVYSY